MINFKDIPSSQGNADNDRFEFFARDFLKEMGFEIVGEPARGRDNGIDIKVKDTRSGSSKHRIPVYILVSCKHMAHSGKSVFPSKEKDIFKRVKEHGCDEFIGFYSTGPSSGLINKLENLCKEPNFKFEIFDSALIETQLLKTDKGMELFHKYFRESYTKWMSELPKTAPTTNIKDELFDAVLTGNLVSEIIKLKTQILDADWPEREHLLRDLINFVDYKNLRISKEIIFFLSKIAGSTRSGLSTSIAITIDSLVINYYPYSEDPADNALVVSISKECIYIASQLLYDAIFHLDNLSVAEWALSILKYLYQQFKYDHSGLDESLILTAYHELEAHMGCPGRGDLADAKLLVSIFKADLSTTGAANPVLPDDLVRRVLDDEFSYKDVK